METELYPELDLLFNFEKSDVIFVINGQKIPAIIALMSAKSVVFRAMFSGNWRESDANQIEIRDTTPEAFKVMVGFIYMERLMFSEDNDLVHIQDVLKIADRYQLKRLITSVGQYLKSMISMDNIQELIQLANAYQLNEVIGDMKKFVDNNFDRLMAKPETERGVINIGLNNYLFDKLSAKYRPNNQPNQSNWITFRNQSENYSFII
ncbi:speckle-type POZ protein B-like [Oppia nitens]|uniref:speckle-type POZ protein B-like n=1 Tax=Oppia nitens TaxID=1686743 RepID=UPI0023D9F9D7|nr:speckle-type POZ protein B-like [Oppia nitens]